MHIILDNNFKDSIISNCKDQLKQKDKILANVTHDLRTPLNAVNYMLDKIEDLVLHKPAPSKIERKNILQESFQIAKVNSNLMLYLISDILDFSQNNQNTLRMNFKIFELSKLINDCRSLL